MIQQRANMPRKPSPQRGEGRVRGLRDNEKMRPFDQVRLLQDCIACADAITAERGGRAQS